MTSQFIQDLILILFLALAIFLICRELVCWYFKINERRDLLIEQNELLRDLHDTLKRSSNDLIDEISQSKQEDAA